MFKRFDDPSFLLEVFYDYNEQVGGKMREEDENEDKFAKAVQKFQKEFEFTRSIRDEKMDILSGNNTERVHILIRFG